MVWAVADSNSYKHKRPDKYQEILSLRKEGKSYNEITAITGAAPSAISRICYENAEELGKWKKRVSNKHGEAIDLLSDRLVSEGGNLSVGQIPVAIAIAIDKKAGLDGDNISHVVHHKGLSHTEMADKLAEMKSAKVVEVDPN